MPAQPRPTLSNLSFSPAKTQAGGKTASFSSRCCCCLGACQEQPPGLKIRFEVCALILKFISSCDWYRWAKCLANRLQLPRRILYTIFIYDIGRENNSWDWLIHNQIADLSGTLTLLGFLILSRSLPLFICFTLCVWQCRLSVCVSLLFWFCNCNEIVSMINWWKSLLPCRIINYNTQTRTATPTRRTSSWMDR